MIKKIGLNKKELFVAIREYLSKRDIELPEDVSIAFGLKKRFPEDLSSTDYIPYAEVEYDE